MSKKSERDNRANQLNPNNPAYHSSRAHSRSKASDAPQGGGERDGEDTTTEIRGREHVPLERGR